MPCAAIFFKDYIPCIKWHHFVQSPYIKELQHFFERVVLKETCSFKEVRESMQGGQHDLRTESFEYLCKIMMVLKKESVGASMGKASFTRGGEPFNLKACNNTEKDYYEVEPLGVCSIFGRNRSWLYLCNMLKVYYKYIKVLIKVYSGYTHVIWDCIKGILNGTVKVY